MIKKYLLILLLIPFILSGCANKKVELNIVTKNISLRESDNSKIDVTVSNGDESLIKYVSLNPSIVGVSSDGIVTGLQQGNGIIDVSYNDIHEYCYVSVTINDTIKKINVPMGAIVLNNHDTFKVDYEIEPSNGVVSHIEYISNDYNIVDINNNGVLTGKKIGKTKIIITINNYISKDIDVYVIDKDITPQFVSLPMDITQKKQELLLNVLNQVSLDEIFTLNINDALYTITSSNENVVTINNGRIIAMSSGKAILTISTINGITKHLNIVISEPVIPVSQIVLEGNSAYDLKINDILNIKASVLPLNATDKKINYTSSDSSIASVTDMGIVKANKVGTAIITLSSNDGKKNVAVIINVIDNPSNNTSHSGNNTSSNNSGQNHSGNNTSSSNNNQSQSGTNISGSGSDDDFESCRRSSPHLSLYINGVKYGQDHYETIRVGNTLTVKVNLPTYCGSIMQLTRNTASGENGWNNYVSQYNSPSASNGSLSGVTSYTWTITGKKVGSVILSQTAQFDVKTKSGRTGNIKSMIRLHIKIVS